MNKKILSGILSVSLAFVFSCDKADRPKGDGGEAPVEYKVLQQRSPKRGVSFNFGQFPKEDCALLGPAVSWSYNWSNNIPSKTTDETFSQYGMEYIQMLWSGNYNADNIRNYKKTHPEAEYLLAFNEPNLTDQANMTPAEAAALWPAVKALAEENGLKIISPAMNYGTKPDYHDPWKWLDEFFAQPGVSPDDVDGIAIHCYMGSQGALKTFVDGFKKYGKPIWLTEFCNWDNDNISAQAQRQYMVEAINYLETEPAVVRYAWFIPRGNGESKCHNSLLTSRKPFELTDLGKVFVNMSTFDKSVWYKSGEAVPAEHYCAYDGILHLNPCSDESGILEVCDLAKDGWMEYQIDVADNGSRMFELRYSAFRDGEVTVSVDGDELLRLALPKTERKWTTISSSVAIPSGKHTLRIASTAPVSPTINWFIIK